MENRQLWTAFPVSLNHHHLPSVSKHDLDGVNAIYIPGFSCTFRLE
jgi:hypothetical protein